MTDLPLDVVERVARAICPYKLRTCPGAACQDCAHVARAGLSILTTADLHALLEARGEGWQTVDSAPRDGTEILAFARGDRNYYGVAEWTLARPAFGLVEGWFWTYAIRPTHWRPLSPPPKE